jgi:peptide deformylase
MPGSSTRAPYAIRVIGDPVLKQRTNDVTDIDGKLARLVDDMFLTMYDAPGLGLAAPQVGVQKRFFVFDHEGNSGVLINPVITESTGEWAYQEGCLSVPGLYFDIVRPKQILITGLDIDGNEIAYEADELDARLFQHELDHLDGVLLTEHLNDVQQKAAKKALRPLMLGEPMPKGSQVILTDGTVQDT